MPATMIQVRDILLAQAHRWAWKDPSVFERLLQEDYTAIGRASALYRLAPDDPNPSPTYHLMLVMSPTDTTSTLLPGLDDDALSHESRAMLRAGIESALTAPLVDTSKIFLMEEGTS